MFKNIQSSKSEVHMFKKIHNKATYDKEHAVCQHVDAHNQDHTPYQHYDTNSEPIFVLAHFLLFC